MTVRRTFVEHVARHCRQRNDAIAAPVHLRASTAILRGPVSEQIQVDAPRQLQEGGRASGSEPPRSVHDLPLTVIEPTLGWVALGLKDIWRYRELLYFLSWRDVKVRYKQTTIGVLWVVLQPVITMIFFTLVFGRLAKLPSDHVPYPLFVFSGLLAWQLFVAGLTGASSSIVGSAGLISKVYFPRLVIPLSKTVAAFVDFAVALAVLIGLMAWYSVAPHLALLALPVFVLLAMLTALAIGLWLSMLNVRYRDVQYIVPFLTQVWLFATPIAYATSAVPSKYRFLFAFNPMTSVVNGFRWALLDKAPHFGIAMTGSIVAVVVLLVSGLVYFKRSERTFTDVV